MKTGTPLSEEILSEVIFIRLITVDNTFALTAFPIRIHNREADVAMVRFVMKAAESASMSRMWTKNCYPLD